MKGVIFILMFLGLQLSAQNFETVDFKNGLSQNSVLSFAQDDSGFVWLGTADGLNRFDGKSTKVFRYNKQLPNSICGNEIMDIVNDNRGNLWIATSSCLNKLNLNNYEFTHFNYDPNSVGSISGRYISQLEIVNDYISIVTENGLDLISLDTEIVTSIEMPKSANVTNVFNLDDEEILISTSLGLYIYIINDDKLLKFESLYDVDYNHENIQRSIVVKTSLFIAYQDEIIKYDLKTGNSKQLYGVDYIETRDIKKFNDKIWFCTSKGIKIYNCDTHEFKSGLKDDLPIGVAIKSFVRTEDEIWFSVGTGVFKYVEGEKLFQTIKINNKQKGIDGFNKVWHLCNEDDEIIVSTEQGISFINTNGEVIPIKEKLPIAMDFQFVSNVSRDEDNMWICTFDSGIYHVDMNTMKVQNYSNTQSGKYYINSNTIRHSLVLDDEVMFSTDGGFYRYDKHTHGVELVTYCAFGRELSNKATFGFVDNTNRLWIGSQNGLFVYDDTKDSYTYISTTTEPALSNNRVRNITQLSDSIFLIGTSSGLNVFNRENSSIDYIDVNSGLTNDVIYSLEIDDDNDIWVSTNKGISVIKTDKEILNFDLEDGLQGSEFNTNASARSKNGDMYFGGLYGISKFDPSKVKDLQDDLKTIITKLEILPHDDETGIEVTYPLKPKYELKNSQCNFIISFAAINYVNPENNTFYYKLEGYNHDWIKVKDRQEVQFMNLPRGTYEFKVRAALRNGDLSANISSLKIKIQSPFYMSLFFRMLLLSILFFVGYLIYRIRINTVENRNKRLEKLVHEQTFKLKHANKLQEIFLNEIPEPLIIFNSDSDIIITNDLYKKMILTDEQIEESLKLGVKKISYENLNSLESETSIANKHYQFKFNRITFNAKDYGIAVLLRDTTKIKNAEYSLKQNENLFRSYFEKSPKGIVYITNPLEPITNCNQRFCELIGMEKSVVLTKTMTELTYKPDLERDVTNFKKAIDEKTAYLFEPNKRLVSFGDRIVLTETHVTFVYNDNDEYQYMFALIHDVTEQRENQKKLIEARTQLIQSEKLASLGQITAGVAHEINNPVNFIYNGVNNLKFLINRIKNKPNSDELETVYEDIQQMIDAVEDGAVRTAEIVKSLRMFTREDTKHLVSYDIISGIESTITLLSNKITMGIDIDRYYESEVYFVNCFPGQLNQVFLNLILNAIESLDKVGTIIIEVKSIDEMVKIVIKDNGSGINPDIGNKIFEPFFSTKGHINGTGLGLSISNSIIKRHNGSIVFDKNEPKGTICIISIPTTLSRNSDM